LVLHRQQGALPSQACFDNTIDRITTMAKNTDGRACKFFPLAVGAAILLCSAAPALHAEAIKIVTAAQVNGTWETKNAEFDILALGHQQLGVQFNGVRDASNGTGNGNVFAGNASGIAHIEGTTAVFKPDDAGDCTITMEFDGKVMRVSQQDGNDADCGFGMGVRADGVYKKTKSGKPTFTDTQ
jgi:hypothetical protein